MVTDDYGFDRIDEFDDEPVNPPIDEFLPAMDWEPSDVELAEIERENDPDDGENWWDDDDTEPDDPLD